MEPITYKNISFSKSDNNIKYNNNCTNEQMDIYGIGSDCGGDGSSLYDLKSIDEDYSIKISKRHNSVNCISSNPNISCTYHDTNDLITYCIDCSRMTCVQCIVSNEHCGHKFTEISKPFANSLLDKFQKQQFPNLLGYKESDKHILSSMDYCLNDLDNQYRENLQLVSTQFKSLHNQLTDIELQITNRLKSTIDKNKQLKKSMEQSIKQDSKKVDSVISKHKDKIKHYKIDDLFDFETKKHIEIIKDSDQIAPILKKRYESINNHGKLSFKHDTLEFNQELVSSIILDLQKVTTIQTEEYKDHKSTTKQHLMINKKIQPYNIDYYLCHGEPIPDGEHSIALDSKFNFNELSISSTNSIDRLLLCNGFSLSLKHFKIPDSIKCLRIGDIKQPIEVNSIPLNVTELHICDGYAHKLEQGMIPSSVKTLYLYDIKQPLSMGSIPSSVKELHLCDGFNIQLAPFIIPDSVITLSLGEIKHQLLNEFIPSSVKKIRIYSLFNHLVIPQNISESIESLVIFGPNNNNSFKQQEILSNGIPSSIKELHLCDHFNQIIEPGLLDGGSLEKLVLYDIKHPLLVDSIPCSLKKLVLLGYNHSLEKDIIKDTLQLLYISKGYNHQLDINLIPKNVEIIKK